MSETVNRHPYSFAVRAWSEHFYFLRDEVTVSNFQCVLIAGMEIMDKCVAQKVDIFNVVLSSGKSGMNLARLKGGKCV